MEQGFPGQHTTTTTVTTSSTTHQPNVRFDPSYIRSLPGMLKCAQMALNLLGFICITCSAFGSHSRGNWFNTVAMLGFWFTGILLGLYLFHVVEKFYRVPWNKIEFIFCAIWSLFYLLAASLAADFARGREAYGAAAFFGFCALGTYAFDAFLKFKAIKSGTPAQGQLHESTKQVSTVTSPAY
ncbi:CKLF-like MARVEL transmembrane domain-containing protein 4 [Chelonus insularis]|uniref:CKLF-like MARVEL transmembrane domain-containing protein 4 n=1 Tax=Chelonus insularis TaxID=460826 RepID=UPI00158E78D1|nr:CKLF-like MARVEL transmembrane domain-containing protein 4 [Chelonus insularis]XP_034940042.1 CKLF-like MARVEL transmembrane domain-containing protein 4 [Chelonus insularis]XP_034940043.1 CKLF-like MARVEL transmembrane domain-containing protein 4 [Chelonus insularis]